MLTKSLHTITAATNVARLILTMGKAPASSYTARELTDKALAALGYTGVEPSDPTYRRIVANATAALMSAQRELRSGRQNAAAARL